MADRSKFSLIPGPIGVHDTSIEKPPMDDAVDHLVNTAQKILRQHGAHIASDLPYTEREVLTAIVIAVRR